ncbi:MAG: IS6 family transposase, partial [archaeon]|nr:IS6 family transposase [archaeon]
FCNSCKKTFVENTEFRNYKGNAQTITLAMDLYFKGLSLRKIQDTLKQFYGLKISHETIRLWINHFMAQINDYTANFVPATSHQWSADEMKIKAGGNWVWTWNVLDKETRFLLATNVTKSRYMKDAQKVFKEAKSVTPFQPESITTDGLQGYKRAVKKEFWTLKNKNTKHFYNSGIEGRINNNRIERLHGSIRERVKVQRGYQNKKTSLRQMENWRTYYNFLRPRQALEGKTPAETALIKIPFYHKNKWHSLIKKAKM